MYPFEDFTDVFLDSANLCLQNISPAVNAGDSTTNLSNLDLKCMPRIFGSEIDMGCYELQVEVKAGYDCIESLITADQQLIDMLETIDLLHANGS